MKNFQVKGVEINIVHETLMALLQLNQQKLLRFIIYTFNNLHRASEKQ